MYADIFVPLPCKTTRHALPYIFSVFNKLLYTFIESERAFKWTYHLSADFAGLSG